MNVVTWRQANMTHNTKTVAAASCSQVMELPKGDCHVAATLPAKPELPPAPMLPDMA
jgi:hypothetical protein